MRRFKYRGRLLKRTWSDDNEVDRVRVSKKPKTRNKKNLHRFQQNSFYKAIFGLLGFMTAMGAIVLIENKLVTSFFILAIYMIVAILSAADSFMTLVVSGNQPHPPQKPHKISQKDSKRQKIQFFPKFKKINFFPIGIQAEAKNVLMWCELISSIGIVVLSCVFFTYEKDELIPPILIKIWGCCCMMKFVRLIIYLTTFKQIGLTFQVFFQLIPFLKSFLGMLLIIFFIFATIGMNFFGGRVSNKTPDLFKRKTGFDLGTNYNYINFNDIPSAILALYVNVINNNWIYFANMFILDEEDKMLHYRWYFVIFQLITNLFVMTILIGFIIDNILKQFEKIIEEEKEKLKKGEELEPLLGESQDRSQLMDESREGTELEVRPAQTGVKFKEDEEDPGVVAEKEDDSDGSNLAPAEEGSGEEDEQEPVEEDILQIDEPVIAEKQPAPVAEEPEEDVEIELEEPVEQPEPELVEPVVEEDPLKPDVGLELEVDPPVEEELPEKVEEPEPAPVEDDVVDDLPEVEDPVDEGGEDGDDGEDGEDGEDNDDSDDSDDGSSNDEIDIPIGMEDLENVRDTSKVNLV